MCLHKMIKQATLSLVDNCIGSFWSQLMSALANLPLTINLSSLFNNVFTPCRELFLKFNEALLSWEFE